MFIIRVIKIPFYQEAQIAENLIGETFPKRYQASFIARYCFIAGQLRFFRITDIPSDEECE